MMSSPTAELFLQAGVISEIFSNYYLCNIEQSELTLGIQELFLLEYQPVIAGLWAV